MCLYKALLGVVRDKGLDHELAEDLLRQTRKRYNQDPYTTAIVWSSPLDDQGEDRLVQRFRLEIGRWLDHHTLEPGLVGILHHHLRSEIVDQINASSVEHMVGPTAPMFDDASSQLISA